MRKLLTSISARNWFLVATLCVLMSCNFPSRRVDRVSESSKPIVLTTFTILADMARNIAGDRLIINSITKLGAEIHGYKPTPSDIVKASKADLIIENGLGLELWANKFIASAGNVPTLTLTKGMQPLLIEGDIYSGKPNPHVWMSPKRAIIFVERLVDAFIKIDPLGEEIFLRRGNAYIKKLRVLDKELFQAISSIPASRRVLVTCEGAFSYLADDYGMKEAYLWPVNSESQVTPKRMLNLINLINERQIPTIFCESTVSAESQLEVARATGAKFGGTFYVDSLSDSNGPASTLLDLHRHNVSLITSGLTYNAVEK